MLETYEKCLAEGKIVPKEDIDLNKARSLFESASNEFRIAKQIEKIGSNVESHLFKTYYDALRELVDAFIIFDRLEVSSHICIFSYLAAKHPELELDWNILDEFRQVRNRICYYGKSLSRSDWKKYKIQFDVYIKTLKNLVAAKISSIEE